MELCPSTERFVDGRCWALAELMLKSIPFNSENPALTLSSCLAITAAIDASKEVDSLVTSLEILWLTSPSSRVTSALHCLESAAD